MIVSQRDGGSVTKTLRGSESGELETASGDGLSEGEGVVEEPSMFEDPVDVAQSIPTRSTVSRGWKLLILLPRLLLFRPSRGACAEEAVGRPPPPFRPVIKIVGKSHPEDDTALKVTRRRDVRSEHVFWFR